MNFSPIQAIRWQVQLCLWEPVGLLALSERLVLRKFAARFPVEFPVRWIVRVLGHLCGGVRVARCRGLGRGLPEHVASQIEVRQIRPLPFAARSFLASLVGCLVLVLQALRQQAHWPVRRNMQVVKE